MNKVSQKCLQQQYCACSLVSGFFFNPNQEIHPFVLGRHHQTLALLCLHVLGYYFFQKLPCLCQGSGVQVRIIRSIVMKHEGDNYRIDGFAL